MCAGCTESSLDSSSQFTSNIPPAIKNPNFNEYTDTLHGYSVQYPKEWNVQKSSEGGVFFQGTPSFHNISCILPNGSTHTISDTLSHGLGIGIVSLRQYPDAPRDLPHLFRYILDIQLKPADGSYEVLTENITTMGNNEAYRVELLIFTKNACNDPAERRIFFVFTLIGENLYSFGYTGSSSSYFADYDIGENSFHTIKFSNTTTTIKPIIPNENHLSVYVNPFVWVILVIIAIIGIFFAYAKYKRKPVILTSSQIPPVDPSKQHHHNVFVSYAQNDKSIANAACAKLESHHIRCWISPRDVPPGENFPKAIIDGIEGSKIMVLIFSSHSNNSQHVIREITTAVNKGLIIIPFRIENIMPSKDMEYLISTPHWLDAITPPLEQHLNTLANTIEKILSDDKPESGGRIE